MIFKYCALIWTFEAVNAQIQIKKWNALDAFHSGKKIALENETHRPVPRYRKLQPILEPGNHESLHNGLRVFVHYVFPYVNQMSQKYHTFIIRLVVKY